MPKKKSKFDNPISTGITPGRGPEAVIRHNAMMRENASSEQKAVMNAVDVELAKMNTSVEDLFCGESFEHEGKTYYKASDTAKEVLGILSESGLSKEELARKIEKMKPGNLQRFGKTWYIKRIDNKLQEVTKYIFTLEKTLIFEKKKKEAPDLGFLGHLKAAFSSLKPVLKPDYWRDM